MKRTDVAVYSPDGRLRLSVEVQRKLDASDDWVQQMRRNLDLFEAIPHAPYFLLVLPECMYLWKEASRSSEATPPDYTVETVSVLTPYLGDPPLSLREISDFGLELLISSWLGDLVNAYRDAGNPAFAHDWLHDSGLYDALQRGEVAVKVPA